MIGNELLQLPSERTGLIRKKKNKGVRPTRTKDCVDFAVSSISAYLLIEGINAILDLSSIKNDIASCLILTAIPYFLTRVVGYASEIYVDKKYTTCDNFGAIPARLAGTAVAAGFGIALGAIGIFNNFKKTDLLYLSSIGMIAGKSIEIISETHSKTCNKT